MDAYKVIFKGNVQGVGFRRKTADYSKELGLKGWVRNLSNGSVELHAQGLPHLIDQLIARLQQQFVIGDIQQTVLDISDLKMDFQITDTL